MRREHTRTPERNWTRDSDSPQVDGTFDKVHADSTADAFVSARRGIRDEDIFSGPSTGANLLVGIRPA